jgi:hypothetical protein
MWKNVFFWLWKVQKGTSSLHREMERPSKQVAWGEAKFVVTMFILYVLYLHKEEPYKGQFRLGE